jgi:hypothetical protein
MKSSSEFSKESLSSKKVEDWSRQWLVIKKIKTKKLLESGNSHRLFEIDDI